jgi:hypothetical protein
MFANLARLLPRRTIAIGLAGVLLGATLGIAVASVPSYTGPLTGCLKANGEIRNVARSASAPLEACGRDETQVTFSNAMGPKGDTGARGPAGPTGAAGATGLRGPLGPTGPRGERGPRGEKGATGATGPAGAAVGDIGCADGQTIVWDDTAGEWVCTDPTVDTLAGLQCTANQSLRWNGTTTEWECANTPITANLFMAAFPPAPGPELHDVFSSWSPNVDASGSCEIFLGCEIRLVDVTDHRVCTVQLTGNSLADATWVASHVFMFSDGILIDQLIEIIPEQLFVNITCPT